MNTKPKYRILRVLGGFLQFLGILFLVVGGITIIGVLLSGDNFVAILGSAGGFFSILFGIQLWILGALIKLMTDLERNTRATALSIQAMQEEMKPIAVTQPAEKTAVVAPPPPLKPDATIELPPPREAPQPEETVVVNAGDEY